MINYLYVATRAMHELHLDCFVIYLIYLTLKLITTFDL